MGEIVADLFRRFCFTLILIFIKYNGWWNCNVHFEIITCSKYKEKWTEKYTREETSFLARNVMFLIQVF